MKKEFNNNIEILKKPNANSGNEKFNKLNNSQLQA
jgi:hypothetical protein